MKDASFYVLIRKVISCNWTLEVSASGFLVLLGKGFEKHLLGFFFSPGISGMCGFIELDLEEKKKRDLLAKRV